LGELKKEKEEKNADKGGKNGTEKRKYAEVLREERNSELHDDLAWCLTIRGYGLLMQARHLREQGLSKKKEATLKEAETILQKSEKVLKEAQGLHRELPGEDEDKDNLAWNLFALAAAQYELVEKDSEKLKAGERSLLEACKMLRKMTRRKKKIWFSDYLEDSLTVLSENENVRGLMKEGTKKEEAKKEEREKRDDIDKLADWWRSSVVREGKEALDNIISVLEEKTAASQ
jgi:cellobiose-specific phosphotransferase system component IIA